MRIQFAVAGALLAAPAAADFATDFGVAWDGVGALEVEFNFDSIETISAFLESGIGGFNGFFSDEPGFANFEEDEADEGLFVVPDGTIVGFRLLAADPAFAVYDPEFDRRLEVGGAAGADEYIIGSVARDALGAVTDGFDDHPWWTVETDSADFDANVFDYDVTFELFDARTDGLALEGTGPITVTFSRIPAPGAGALALAAGLLGSTRRRR